MNISPPNPEPVPQPAKTAFTGEGGDFDNHAAQPADAGCETHGPGMLKIDAADLGGFTYRWYQ